MKVYDVKMKYHNIGLERELNWPYTETMVVKSFTSQKLAEEYVEKHFIRFMNEVDGFCDLLIYEKVVDEKVEDVDKTTAPIFWVSARLDRHFQIKEMDFINKGEGEGLKEHIYVDNMDKEYSVLYKMPMNGIKTREDVISYIKKRAADITPAF